MRDAVKGATGKLRLARAEPDRLFVEPGFIDSFPAFELIEFLFRSRGDPGGGNRKWFAIHVAGLADPAFLRSGLVPFQVGAEGRRARTRRATELPDQKNPAVLVVILL